MLILYNPPSSARRKPVMPLSLLALGAVLEGRHEYTIVDGNLDPRPLETIDRLVRERGADMLGVTFMGNRTLPHHSSYGCPFFCNFCAVVNMVGGRWLAQSAERTAGVTRRLVKDFGADAVEFYDNNFFVHEARTAEFAERVLDLDI